MNWIDKLERRYGNLGIPYLINGLMIGQLATGLIVLLFDWKFASMISLSRISVLQGDRKSTRVNSSHRRTSRMPSSA